MVSLIDLSTIAEACTIGLLAESVTFPKALPMVGGGAVGPFFPAGAWANPIIAMKDEKIIVAAIFLTKLYLDSKFNFNLLFKIDLYCKRPEINGKPRNKSGKKWLGTKTNQDGMIKPGRKSKKV